MTTLDKLYLKMMEWDKGETDLIQHFAKVHSFAKLIGAGEGLSEEEMFLLETEAYIHDIGIVPARKQFGSGSGKYQEKVSDGPVREILGSLGYEQSLIERAAYVICHHHTYDNIDGLDYQILVEADFLVNLFEGNESPEACETACTKIFKTETGKKLFDLMFRK